MSDFDYGYQDYWESRYTSQRGQTFDWLQDYSSIKEGFSDLFQNKKVRILNIGCGNSELGEKLFEDGFYHTYNIDYCKNVIDFMQERNKNKKGLHYEQKDVLNLEYKKEIFDLIIDKATMDTVLCTDNALLNITKMTKEISRALKTGGVYLVLSYGRPDERLIHLRRDHLAFDIKICKIVKSEKNGKINYDLSIQEEDDEEINENAKEEKRVHYAYVCKKLPEANDKLENFRQVYNEMKEYLAKCEKESSSDNEKRENSDKENKEINIEKKNKIMDENNSNKEKVEIMDIEEETKEEKKNIEFDENSIEQFFDY